MKFLAAAALLALTLAAAPAALANDDQADASPTPSIYTRALQFVHLKHRPAPAPGAAVVVHHQLELKIDVSPQPVRLSDTRQMRVAVSLFNRSKKYAHLDFPTTQRIEVLLQNSGGKVITQWSEDQSFTNDPSSITINPGERLEYVASVSTREMAAGQSYTVEAFFPNFEELKIQQSVTAVP